MRGWRPIRRASSFGRSGRSSRTRTRCNTASPNAHHNPGPPEKVYLAFAPAWTIPAGSFHGPSDSAVVANQREDGEGEP